MSSSVGPGPSLIGVGAAPAPSKCQSSTNEATPNAPVKASKENNVTAIPDKLIERPSVDVVPSNPCVGDAVAGLPGKAKPKAQSHRLKTLNTSPIAPMNAAKVSVTTHETHTAEPKLNVSEEMDDSDAEDIEAELAAENDNPDVASKSTSSGPSRSVSPNLDACALSLESHSRPQAKDIRPLKRVHNDLSSDATAKRICTTPLTSAAPRASYSFSPVVAKTFT